MTKVKSKTKLSRIGTAFAGMPSTEQPTKRDEALHVLKASNSGGHRGKRARNVTLPTVKFNDGDEA